MVVIPYGPGPSGAIHGHLAGRWDEHSVDAILTREPETAAEIKRCGVEIGVGAVGRQRKRRDRFGQRIDADDGVQAAVGDPRGAVGADDDAVGS